MKRAKFQIDLSLKLNFTCLETRLTSSASSPSLPSNAASAVRFFESFFCLSVWNQVLVGGPHTTWKLYKGPEKVGMCEQCVWRCEGI